MDDTYQPKVYRKQGGDEFVVASGGKITVESGGLIVIESGGPVSYFTDFLGDALEDELLAGVGSGTGNAVAISAGVGGHVEIKTSSADAADAANISSLSLGGLNWKANQGGLVMEARLQIDAITAVAVFVGFTDTLASTVEMPIFLNAADIDSTADDACGVLFDTDGTTDEWCHGGVKATVDTVPAYNGDAPAAATYYTVRVEVSADGAVQGFIDGVAIGDPVPDAVTPTVALTPIIVANNRGAAARNVLVDYLFVQGDRA
ncbi:hypothetical protein [Mesorhizobium sp.]|uniref:hypothetical protein n=1 Tax=Mesorhizobium sp. TaxID=1871066 RepID=UPI000FE56978|nr:hypothetical protein [Mesorhizobium sp.]RWP31812.1 MAG: hypothetical protein EOR02_08330 [Mesorhizobium sp.]